MKKIFGSESSESFSPADAYGMDGRKTGRVRFFRAIKILLVCWCVGGVLCFMSTLIISLLNMGDRPLVFSRVRFPLGALNDIGTDSRGVIYCGLCSYNRIQAYSPDGTFLFGWFVNAHGGLSSIFIDEQDQIHVLAAKHSESHVERVYYYVYNTQGQLLLAKDMFSKEKVGIFETDYPKPVMDRDGNCYERYEKYIVTKVVKTTPGGQKIPVISDPFYLWFFKSPLPAWLWVAIPMLLFAPIKKWENR